ncbi:RNA-binding protein with serine-rich domain 1 [Colletotrichum tanaceti]|uniref:RNA-binding protein with serine-rich domain 1 n=1 Tax=Colletotrichum tanaceti TaxID=1306861 RepID=A0A4U6XK50_9PEZI|nr:RNA-binding protein with serine-rich domain 1 [Colletotrichum tanaceti]TKW54647.1 RNA-binding protein with serine-rich domain 1 [Colletotrichum tanaceti]
MASTLRSPSRERYRSRTRSLTPMSDRSRSPARRRSYDSRSPSRSRSPTPRRSGKHRTESRSRSRSRSDSRGRSASPSVRTTKIVVERLTKNINVDHLEEIFGQYGRIKDLHLPINGTLGTNRGTAYILYETEADAEEAIAHMHEAQLDGTVINVSIVLPRRKVSPAPPQARRGGGFDPRGPPPGGRGGRGAGGRGAGSFGYNGPRRGTSPPPGRFGPRSDTYRPGSPSRSPTRSPGAAPPSRGDGSRYRSRSRSYSRSPSPPPRRGGGGRGNDRNRRRRSPSRDSYESYDSRRSRSPSQSRDRGGRGGGRGYR